MLVMMKSSLSGLVLLLLLLSSSVPVLGSVEKRQYNYFPFHLNWKDAQSHCRRSHYYTDLATIYLNSEADRFNLKGYYAWVGLRKSDSVVGPSTSAWIWNNGQRDTLNSWANDEPDSGDTCAYIQYGNKRLLANGCGTAFFFYCYELNQDNVVYAFIPQPMDWSRAQKYCKENFLDLAAFQNKSELDFVVTEQDFPVWTGLHRDGNTWKWSTGSSEYRKWALDEPGSNGDCVAMSSKTKEMATQNCAAKFPFICVRDNLVLVKENKSWEKALEHCRSLKSPHNSKLFFDLVSVDPGNEHNYIMGKVYGASSEKVWTGLRYLAGHWLWMNKAKVLTSNLSICPLMGQHCGALSKNDTGSVEPTDCSQELNFLCYHT